MAAQPRCVEMGATVTGYFDDVLDSYGAAPALADLTNPDPLTDVPPPVEEPLLAPQTAPEPKVRDRPQASAQAVPEAPSAVARPMAVTETKGEPATPQADTPTPLTPKIIERETRIAEPPEPQAPSIADISHSSEPIPGQDLHIHETVDRSTVHLHEHPQIVDDSAFEPEPFDLVAPADPEEPVDRIPEPGQRQPGPDPEFARLEAELASALERLHGAASAPTAPLVTPDAFEPETPDIPPLPDIDPVREVTREVVTEVHHHHTTETRVEPPSTPPPRTAAEASQIGPIRFASDWKTGGR